MATIRDYMESQEEQEEQGEKKENTMTFLEKILSAETGPGSVDEYIDHPLNFMGSSGLAQVLRGFTGMLGDLRLGIVDLFVGIIRLFVERNKRNKL